LAWIGVDLGGIDFEAGLSAVARRTIASRWRASPAALRAAAGCPAGIQRTPASSRLVGGLFGETQVAEMNRVESAAKNSQRPLAGAPQASLS
jgi:hypothetical protein